MCSNPFGVRRSEMSTRTGLSPIPEAVARPPAQHTKSDRWRRLPPSLRCLPAILSSHEIIVYSRSRELLRPDPDKLAPAPADLSLGDLHKTSNLLVLCSQQCVTLKTLNIVPHPAGFLPTI